MWSLFTLRNTNLSLRESGDTSKKPGDLVLVISSLQLLCTHRVFVSLKERLSHPKFRCVLHTTLTFNIRSIKRVALKKKLRIGWTSMLRGPLDKFISNYRIFLQKNIFRICLITYKKHYKPASTGTPPSPTKKSEVCTYYR